jgi:hypothetical protein
MRGQTSLPALGLALLVLTAATVVAVAVAGGALAGAERAPLDRQAAVALSDRLTDERAPVTDRANVLNRSRLAALSPSTLRTRYGLAADAAVRVRLDERTLASDGRARDGRTVRRLVLVQDRVERTITPAFDAGNALTLPRRTDRVRLSISPANTTVRTVRINEQIELHNTTGLDGTFTVDVSPYETARISLEATGQLSTGAAEIRYYPTRTRKARLVVTVDG